MQGYMFSEDVSFMQPGDARKDPIRGLGEGLIAFTLLLLILTVFPRRHFMETDYAEKKVADALITAQFLERYLQEHKSQA